MMSGMRIKEINAEVFQAEDNIVRLDKNAIDFIKNQASKSPRGRARICAHRQPDDNLHEMIIAIMSHSYIRPHRHHNKVESFHLIEGRADVVIFNDNGDIEEVVPLGENHNFYYRLSTPHYHTLIIHSPILVIHEITNGPFDINASDFALFSPDGCQELESAKYMENMKRIVASYVESEK